MATGRIPTTANSPLTAKGDLFTFSTGSAKLAVGNNGDTLVADSAATTGLRWTENYAAGKNKIINGDFGIWQRGTSFAPSAAGFYYTADRWVTYNFATSTTTVSQQAFTAGTAPVTGYESQYFLRINSTNTQAYIEQRIEDVRTFANSTVTLSFWAKSASAQTLSGFKIYQAFGSGGSANVDINGTAPSITTSWARYSATFTIPSISGKTIGAGSSLTVAFGGVINNALDIWGVQVEDGSVATAFQTATGTLQGELAACQRYYYRQTVGTTYGYLAFGMATSTTNGKIQIPLPVPLRIIPTSIDSPTAATLRFTDGVTGTACNASPTLDADTSSNSITFNAGVASGLTQYRPIFFGANNSAVAYIGFSAEL
jgi:hypothetical protein